MTKVEQLRDKGFSRQKESSVESDKDLLRIRPQQMQNLIYNRFAFLNKYRILSQGSNFNYCRNYCMRVDRHESVTKHRDFLVCPDTTISSTAKPKLLLKSLDISKQDLQFSDRLGEFFRGNSRTISDCRVSSIKALPASRARYLDTK